MGNIDTSATPQQILLTTDWSDHAPKFTETTRSDSFDITFSPRSLGSPFPNSSRSLNTITPRQQDLRDGLELPVLHTQPLPPTSSLEDTHEERERKLLEMYKEFAIELHTGMYLTQLTSNREYSDIHCQLMEDMQTLKLDQSNGRIIEFPLTGVSKVYRIVKNDDRWYSAANNTSTSSAPPNAEHIVVVEFMRRKLAFVFKSLQMSQRFLMCMELLIRRAQQKQAKKAMRSLTPAFPRQIHATTKPASKQEPLARREPPGGRQPPAQAVRIVSQDPNDHEETNETDV